MINVIISNVNDQSKSFFSSSSSSSSSFSFGSPASNFKMLNIFHDFNFPIRSAFSDDLKFDTQDTRDIDSDFFLDDF